MSTATTTPSPPRIRPGDPGYAHLSGRGNPRFGGRPEMIRPVTTTDEVVLAVQEAVDSGHRIAVRSGGHNLEDFVDHPQVHTVIDTSAMRQVAYDSERKAFMVEPGATLGEAYRELADRWAVTVPAGLYPGVGVGGHIAGGGYGFLSRLHGLAVDHLHAVEVVVVDADGRARAVVATRDREDSRRDLWWAHTGGGGGTFGIVTRYWLRSPGAADAPPARQLPAVPAAALRFSLTWDWADLDERTFALLVGNHGEWAARESGPDSPYAGMHSEFYLWRRPRGSITLEGVFAARAEDDREEIRRLLERHLDEIGDGTALDPVVSMEWIPWLQVFDDDQELGWGQFRMKVKDAYARQPLSGEQIRTLYHHLTRADTEAIGACLCLHTYGGAINTVNPSATAIAQRDSILKVVPIAVWAADGHGEEQHLRFTSELYRDLFADTGGVPVPSERTDGSYLNQPDLDLADPQWNTSDVPWHELYHRGNYPRLQQVKAAWDPKDVFHHAYSVRPG
ncbi:FAD-binding protein [Brachybacterium sp. FME24]|uniref:FAD-binding protein n=1 Tax=Brachybacterium sp. FME24 TaxID=2742605 RepID=UPI0018679CC4|nr:FAD-binding protein [Brachybacterium sp. FME24]